MSNEEELAALREVEKAARETYADPDNKAVRRLDGALARLDAILAKQGAQAKETKP
jgi:hypothetical protein